MRRTATTDGFSIDTYRISGHWRLHDGDIIEFPSHEGHMQGVFILRKSPKDIDPCSECCVEQYACPRVRTASSVRLLCSKISNGHLESVGEMMEEL